MTNNLHCPECDNIIHRYTENTTINAVLYCRKCKTEWQTVIANNTVYDVRENKLNDSDMCIYRENEDETFYKMRPKEFIMDKNVDPKTSVEESMKFHTKRFMKYVDANKIK